jgi:1,4-alpha-glucan branching enzyme
MVSKMPGDEWQQFANLRALYGFMYGHPGKKLLFMGCEFGQRSEWNHATSLEWHVLEYPLHRGMQRLVEDLNNLYRNEPALYERDAEWHGFEWIDCSDSPGNIVSFLRRGADEDDVIVFVCNFSPAVREGYGVGVPKLGRWREVLNTDAETYGGSNQGNAGLVEAMVQETHGRPGTLLLTLPPLAVVAFKPEPTA